MLVLSRKTDGVIHIDGGICVRVVRIKGRRVLLGVEAPDGIGIYRGEAKRRPDAEEEVTRS